MLMKFLLVFRWLLFPFAFLYGVIGWFRNKLYDCKILKSTGFDVFMVGVGNLSSGGTGKTPHVEYLINLWKDEYAIATLSRGYKRKTKGFVLAKEGVTALEIGDEPMQIYRKFPEIEVAVGESRVEAVERLLEEKSDIEVIVLDDVFQHRSINVDVNILLTDYHHLFTNDWVLPTGNLREFRGGYKRADIIIITKCPNDLSKMQRAEIIGEIRSLAHQRVLFSYLRYHQAYSFFDRQATLEWEKVEEILVVCGIAKPERMVEYLKTKVDKVHLLPFGDHHDFSKEDLERIQKRYIAISSNRKVLVTTEKDAVRLEVYWDWLKESGLEVFCLPIEVELKEEDREFLRGVYPN